MEIRSRTEDNIEIVELEGRFDAYEAPAFSGWFDQHPDVSHVIVDLGGVGFIDSLGLSILVKGLKRCRQNQGDLHLCNMQQSILIIFELTHLNLAFNVFEDTEAARLAFRSVNPV